jgi:23S rRNA-/tRNA-specific pseudouridylate synthase
VYEDRWLLVVDKPAGLPTQRTEAGEPGLFEQLAARERIFLHHRLDRPASGLVLFTRHPDANAPITDALRDHRVRRRYLAVLGAIPREPRWTWPLDGREARSEVAVLAEGAYVAAALELHTGRTHQLRRHAALAGAPILGDRRYGGELSRAWPRLALHAAALDLDHPVTGAALSLRAHLPADLAPLWALCGASSDVFDTAPAGP